MSEHGENPWAALYRHHATEQPSALIDRRILHAARQQVRPRQPWAWTWAAALLLVTGLAVLLKQPAAPARAVPLVKDAGLELGRSVDPTQGYLLRVDLRAPPSGPAASLEWAALPPR